MCRASEQRRVQFWTLKHVCSSSDCTNPQLTRAPRQLLTGWVAHSRPNGCPEMTWGRTLKKALKCKGLPVNFKEWIGRSGDHGRTRNLCLLPRIDPTGFIKVKMNIALRKRTLSPVILVLEDSSKRSFMLFVVVSLQLGSII